MQFDPCVGGKASVNSSLLLVTLLFPGYYLRLQPRIPGNSAPCLGWYSANN